MSLFEMAYQYHLQKLLGDTTITVTDLSEDCVSFSIPADQPFSPPYGVHLTFLGIAEEQVHFTVLTRNLEEQLRAAEALTFFFDDAKP